jgi:hypothetical protein
MKFAKASANIWSQAAIRADLQLVCQAPTQEIGSGVGNNAEPFSPQYSESVEGQLLQPGNLGFNGRIWDEKHELAYGTIL